MTSKEALEQIRFKAQLLSLIEGEKAHQFLDLIDNLYSIIKQALERLEVLEKVVDWLKNRFKLEIWQENGKEYFCVNDFVYDIDDELLKLLKEVLGNDK